jgi:dally
LSTGEFISIFRGCLTQFLGGLDADWASFSESVERLITLVRSKDGIESVVKNLDGRLSEAIMHAMTNGPELEKKVSNRLRVNTFVT